MKLDPQDAGAYAVLSGLSAADDYRGQEAILLRGIKFARHPKQPLAALYSYEGLLLGDVGRLREALSFQMVAQAKKVWESPTVQEAAGVVQAQATRLYDEGKQVVSDQVHKMGFDFGIEDADFQFKADTRPADLADQLYLFAAKFAMPRWDPNPVQRAKAAAKLQYNTYTASPQGVLQRDLGFYQRGGDPRYKTPTPAEIDAATPAGFKALWAPLLAKNERFDLGSVL